ncbi:MAG: PAS domain-containing protein [Cyclobacteriaceae bacterium]
MDTDYRYIDFTEQHKQTMLSIWGLKIELGACMLDYITSPEDQQRAKDNFDKVLSGDQLILREEYGDHHLQRSYYENRYSPIYNYQNKIIGLSVYVIDITKVKQLERQKEEYLQSLEVKIAERTKALQDTNQELTQQKESLIATLKELTTTQNKLIESEKMASLGILTAGVAHEINNPLNFISSGIGILRDLYKNHQTSDANFEMSSSKVLSNIQVGIDQATDIVRSLNRFSRQSRETTENIDLHQIIDDCLLILNHETKDKCIVTKQYCSDSLDITDNQGQLHQVFLNVVHKAIRATEANGLINIKTDKSNTGITVTLKDNGVGIKEEHLNKVYDPFFTTKPPGKGTGLGLALVYRVIGEYNGSIAIKSKHNKGTTVIINLPASL